MDAFSYLSVVLSIILGLGLTQVLTAVGRLIRHRDRVQLDWLPLLWAAVMLGVYVQVWWAMFGLRYHQDWTFAAFSIVVAQTATLYVMAALVLPEQVEEEGVDLRAYYDRHHRWFFGCFFATLVVSAWKDVVLTGRMPQTANLTFHVVLAAACVVGIAVPHRRVQQLLGVGCAIVIAAYISLLFAHLQ
jgi:hypothetical protein